MSVVDDFIKNLAYKTAMDKITESIRVVVDQQMTEEIANLRNMSRKTLEEAVFNNSCRILNIKNEE